MQVPEDLEVRLIRMVADSKKVDAGTIGLETTCDSLQIDSLDKINLTFAVEEAFGIEIPDSALGSIQTVGNMVEGVSRLVAARAE